MVATVILCLVIAVLMVFALRRAIKTFTGDGACHGGGGGKKVRSVKVEDTDETNYPYSEDLAIGGMTCDKCVSAVENTFNAFDGVWARVSLDEKKAHVLSKQPLDKDAIDSALREAGYFLARQI